MAGELPQKKNKRGGVGWWMDEEGRWRAPGDWPGDEPPVDGWVRSKKGPWHPPAEPKPKVEPVDESEVVVEPAKKRRRSTLDAEPETPAASEPTGTDVRALLVGGTAVVVAVAISIAVLLTQTGAEASSDDANANAPEVVFAAETEQVRTERRIEMAADAPDLASRELAQLADFTQDALSAEDDSPFDETLWEPQPEDCLDPAELVLIERSTTPIEWADNLECVPAEGLWHDPYVDVLIGRTIDADVQSLIPLEIVDASGGDVWNPATRALFANDVTHPATLVILSRDSGHNPRSQGPDGWRPSNESTWCGYAIDWISVKHRWELSVTTEERAALTEMLQTCSEPTSDGAHLSSMAIDPVVTPMIQRIEAG